MTLGFLVFINYHSYVEYDTNVFNNNAPYYLMFSSIDELTLGDNYS